MTHTFARLKVSAAAYDEIKAKLLAAGYSHAFLGHDGGIIVIDMHGIALEKDSKKGDS